MLHPSIRWTGVPHWAGCGISNHAWHTSHNGSTARQIQANSPPGILVSHSAGVDELALTGAPFAHKTQRCRA